jgi:hypothetical protein
MNAPLHSLRAIARALGGEVVSGSVCAPGPGHSPRDRSLSITLSARAPNGFLVNSFAGDDALTCLDYVRAKLGLPAFEAAAPQKRAIGAHHAEPDEPPDGDSARDESERKAEMAHWLWSIREPISESNAAGLYLRKTRRYGGPIPATLGYLPANGKHPPAMIAAFGFCEEPEPGVIVPPVDVTGVHITRLTPDGRKAPVDPVKIMLGPSMGLPIVLAPANDLLAIDITEGIETGLSVLEMRGAGVWVAGAAGRLPALVENLPGYVECLHIFAERDAGMRFAQEAARIAAARGIETHVKAYEAKP